MTQNILKECKYASSCGKEFSLPTALQIAGSWIRLQLIPGSGA